MKSVRIKGAPIHYVNTPDELGITDIKETSRSRRTIIIVRVILSNFVSSSLI
jgi:hypothetical protein